MKFFSKVLYGCLALLFCTHLSGQDGYHFGMKGGISLANQTWNDSERRMLLTYHGNLFVESRDDNNRGALYAQLGMHTRGSSIRVFNIGGGSLDNGYKFQNLSLQVGAKKKISSGLSAQPYYFLGIRGEYTLGNNLQSLYEDYCTVITTQFQCSIPDPIFINKVNYGISIGGGFEFSGGEFFTPAIEFSINPDLSYQYDQREPINSIVGTVPARRIRNLTFEVSLVMKFLREIVYTN